MSDKLNAQQMEQLLEKLMAENLALKKNASARYKVKKSDKSDGIMLLGLRRFPVTFFPEEWKVIYSDEVRKQVEAAIK